jgi:KUP system potassium uptake protein
MTGNGGERESGLVGIVKSLGLVFGDIGTSPIYTLAVIFALTRPTPGNVLGILSLIVWTLMTLVTAEYVWLAMSLGKKGEGGTIVLREILISLLAPGRQAGLVVVLSYVGISLLLGDGVITPAISILSAVEGMLLIPGFSGVGQGVLIAVAACIAVALFIFQSRGTDRVATWFGPIMVAWFVALAVTGTASIVTWPGVISALSPHHGVRFLVENGLAGFFVLSEVILCATGGEALFADMGHLGGKPIRQAWGLVFVALVLSYLGQGAYAAAHPEAGNFLFAMVRDQAPFLYVPFLLLTIMATVIASQAMISGVFSSVYQGITTRIMPLLKVDYTSRFMKSQIYIRSVNWGLMVAVIFIMLLFRRSENLAAAYGFAVTGTMTITGIFMVMIFLLTKDRWKLPVAILVTVADLVFLVANLNKIPHGGYWSLILAAFPLATILVWTHGQRALYSAMRPLDLSDFMIGYRQIYAKGRTIPGTGVFFTRDTDVIPPYITHCMIRSNIIYERNVLISVLRTDVPYGVEDTLATGIGPGLDSLMVRAGYMEILDIEAIMAQNGIDEKTIFYGVEDIGTKNPVWSVFSVLKRLTPNFVQFHKLPVAKLQGVVTKVEM